MAAGGAKSSDVQKEEDRLQAIVLADSFTGTFRPCSLDRPKVLLPLLNVPMLDYVMEFLVSSGVQEVFIFCVNKREVVQEYVARSKWPSSVALRCISSAKCMGAGDALREMDGLGLIRSNPFVIISGDVVSTVNLPAVIAAHKRRKAENSLNILTVVLSKVGYEAGVHPREEDLVVGLDKGTEQLLVYEDDADDSRAEVALALVKEEGHPELRLRNDLMDTHIYVCSPEVLVAFSDNWDYQDLGRYLRNEVQNREMGNRLFAHVTGPHEYAVRVHDPHVYHAVSLDLLHRWLYPNVPENNNIHSGSEHTTYRYHKRWLYKEAGDGTAEGGVHVSRSAAISKSVMLGQGTSIGPGSELSTSVLGRRVRVGANVTIRDSHIWNDVVIEDGAVIESSVLADEVVVRAGARVGRGSMLSYGVVLGAGVDLPPFSRLTATPASSWGHDGGSSSSHSHFHSFEGAYSPSSASPLASSPRSFGNRTPGGMMAGEAVEAVTDPTVVGPDGVGRAWAPLFDGERISEAELRMQSIGATEEDGARRQRWAQLEEEEYDEEEQTPLQGSAEGLSLTTAGPYHPDTAAAPAAVAVAPGSTTTDAYFAHVVHDMIVSGYASRHPVANILLEVKSFKFAHNRTFAAVVSAAVPALLDLALDPDVVFRQAADDEDEEEGPRRGMEGAAGASPAAVTAVVLPDKAALANIEAQLEYWDALLRALNQEPEVEAAVLAATEEYALQEGPDGTLLPNAQSLHNVFGLVLVSYVNAEVVHKEAALAWVEQHELAAAAGMGGSSSSLQQRAQALFQTPRTQKLVAWIHAYESESEKESSGSSDDDEESSEEED